MRSIPFVYLLQLILVAVIPKCLFPQLCPAGPPEGSRSSHKPGGIRNLAPFAFLWSALGSTPSRHLGQTPKPRWQNCCGQDLAYTRHVHPAHIPSEIIALGRSTFHPSLSQIQPRHQIIRENSTDPFLMQTHTLQRGLMSTI